MMKYWVLLITIVALLSNLMILLLTFPENKLVTIVLIILAVLANLIVAILLALQPRTQLAKLVSTDLTKPAVIPATTTDPNFERIIDERDKYTLLIDPDTDADKLFSKNVSPESLSATASAEPVSSSIIKELLGTVSKPDSTSGDKQDHYDMPDRENLLDNSQWLKLVEECIELEGDLVNLYEHLDDTSQHIVDHTILRIQEILERSDVEIIADEHEFNRARHETKPKHPIPSSGTLITTTLHPGFAVGRRVLRRALVQVK